MIVVQFSCNTPASVASFHVMMRSLFFISQVLEMANVIIYLIIFDTDFSLQLIKACSLLQFVLSVTRFNHLPFHTFISRLQ
jgi:hypothetical protein